MELSAPRGFRWDIWIPCVTAVLVLSALLVCFFLPKGSSASVEAGLKLQRITNAETNEVIADGDLDDILDLIRTAGNGDRQTLSDKLPPIGLVFSDGSTWTIRFTERGDTICAETGKNRNWLYSEKLSRALSSIYYTSTLPEPTEVPSISPSPVP